MLVGTAVGFVVKDRQLDLHPTYRAYYHRKRAEDKTHTQAALALARRRINVIWAMLGDGRSFERRPALSRQIA